MHDYWQTVIGRQFAAAIQMLQSALEACPDAYGTPFWHLAYHTLFYMDFLLVGRCDTFQARDCHIEKVIVLPGDYEQFSGRHHSGKGIHKEPAT
jgi:hypothetical protein